MFDHLSTFDKILVTGPQRSGTRIAAKMIAHDLTYQLVTEETFDVHSVKEFTKLVNRNFQMVVQCPGMCHVIHKFTTSNICVVLMRRDIDDIIASEKRVGWEFGQMDELLKYGVKYEHLRWYLRKGNPSISQLKYELWDTYQKDKIIHRFELGYSSLNIHPLWIPKEERIHFGVTQTE
jgi:hypothetical protein